MADTWEELRQLIAERAYNNDGHFRTPSGVINSYFDFFKISLKHQGIKLSGELVYEEIKDLFDLHGVKIEGCVAFERDKLLKIVNSFLKSTMTSTENIADSNYNKEGTALAI